MKLNAKTYVSTVVENLLPYTWEEVPMGTSYRFDMNTLPCTPNSLGTFLADMKNYCPINEYTDPTNKSLKRQIAQYENVDQSMITLTNSGDEGIDILAKAFINPGETFITTPPTYEMFSIQCTLNRGIVREIPLCAETFAVEADRLISTSKKKNVKLMFLVNPNNPTGTIIPPEDLEMIIQDSNCIVVVDEVYREFYGKSVVPLIAKYQNLVVLRSFSKFAGIAGARVGYLVADTSLTQLFESIKLPMGVSYFSSRLAQSVLQNDKKWIEKQVASIITERAKLEKDISAIGCTVVPSQANFILVKFGSKANKICDALRRIGIIVRDRSQKPYLNGYVRITVRSPKENRLLIQALKEIL
jgi:histidinol-phosphate aminotransferase